MNRQLPPGLRYTPSWNGGSLAVSTNHTRSQPPAPAHKYGDLGPLSLARFGNVVYGLEGACRSSGSPRRNRALGRTPRSAAQLAFAPNVISVEKQALDYSGS